MCLLVLFLLAACACWARYRQHKRAAWFLVTTLTILSLALGLAAVSGAILNAVQDPEQMPAEIEWKAKNSIVVLGAGTDRKGTLAEVHTIPIGYSRVFEGARRYFECMKAKKLCQLILTGGDPWDHGVSEAEVMGKELEEIGVPRAAITLEPKSFNTFQNAEFTAEILAHDKPDQVVLVTSGFHLHRALLYFSHFDLHAIGVASDHWKGRGGAIPMAVNMAMIDVALHEELGIVLYYIYGFMGWNK